MKRKNNFALNTVIKLNFYSPQMNKLKEFKDTQDAQWIYNTKMDAKCLTQKSWYQSQHKFNSIQLYLYSAKYNKVTSGHFACWAGLDHVLGLCNGNSFFVNLFSKGYWYSCDYKVGTETEIFTSSWRSWNTTDPRFILGCLWDKFRVAFYRCYHLIWDDSTAAT